MLEIAILVDNHAQKQFKAEWGLSMLISFKGKRILFDFGSSSLYIQNGKMLGLDPINADYFVLSHGHWDHGNGL